MPDTTELLRKGTEDSKLVDIIISESIKKDISRLEDNGETPIVLAVYDKNNLLGYKADSCWTLSPDKFKVHPLRDAMPTEHLARNLLFAFQEDKNDEFNEEAFKGTWFRRFPQGVKVVVEDLREDNFGNELLSYKIIKQGDSYIIE